jgi:cytoskeletal protein CcmA (bactofilin family)
MNRKFSMIVLILAAVLLTSCTATSFSGNYVLGAGETLRGNLFVTSGTVTLEENSRVTGTILITSGVLQMDKNSEVGGDVALTSGDVYMEEGSVIHGDLIMSSDDGGLHKSPGATVEGSTTSNIAPFVGSILTKGILLYCILPIVLLIALILGLGTWLGRQSKKRPEIVPSPAQASVEDTPTKLQNLKKMLDDGLISPTDYETKKADILAKM